MAQVSSGTDMKQWASDGLREMEPLITLTSDGQIALLKSLGNAEDFVVACLVTQHLAHRAGRTAKQTLAIDDIIAAGGLAQRVARQTIYNATSTLAKARIIRKNGNEFYVDERAVLQFFSARLPALVGAK